MSEQNRRRLVTVGVLTAGAAALTGTLGLGARGLLGHQAAAARQLIGKPHGEQAPGGDRTYKKSYGNPLDLLLVGDSIAAGLGAERGRDTLGGRLAKHLAKESGRAVRLTTVAVVGSETSRVAGQLDALAERSPGYRPHVAVLVVGGNDVTHRVPVAQSARQLEDAVGRLREWGAEVVVGTCPDLGMLRALRQPLRSLASRSSRQLAAAQREATVRAGGHAVSLAHVVGPFFLANPDEMFSLDRFHPSALGYRRAAKALLPSVLLALGLRAQAPFGHVAPVPAAPVPAAPVGPT